MDRQHLGRRAVSLVLALELLLSPVAMARAADPAQILPVPEIPLGEEVLTQDLPGTGSAQSSQASLQESGGLPFDRVMISSNLDLRWVEKDERVWDKTEFPWTSTWIFTTFYRLNLYDDKHDPSHGPTNLELNVELPADKLTYEDTDVNPLIGSLWYFHNDSMKSSKKHTGQVSGEDSRYTYLPTLSDARVPDMKFDGYGRVITTTDGEGNSVESIRFLGEDGEVFLESEPAGLQWDDPSDLSSISNPPSQLVKLRSTYDTVVEAEGVADDNYLPLTAWFSPSDQAKLTALAITSYGTMVNETVITDIYTQNPLETETPTSIPLTDFASRRYGEEGDGPEVGNETGEELAAREMWLQVGRDQTSLDLHLQTYEPYYSYTKDTGPQEGAVCPIAVTYTMDGGAKRALELTQGENMQCQFLPRPDRPNATTSNGTNSAEDKARGDWQVTGIPLVEEDNDETAWIDITLTVTAPDGVTQTDYIIHVQRRQNTSGKHTSAYGNTPFGMIARDDSTKWNNELTKELSRTRFKTINTRRFADPDTRPSGPVNQLGGIYQRTYFYCWPMPSAGEQPDANDVDLDETAIVAYQDAMFQDPGVTFTDSFGRNVDLTNHLYHGSVTRTIQLQTPQSGKLSADSWTLLDALTDTCWYNVIDNEPTLTTDKTKAAQVLTSLDQEVDLRRLMVLPGIYQIVYQYTDPFTDATTPESGDTPTYNDTIRRTLVVLPIPGDVDMDGAVTIADAYAMEANLTQWQNSAATNARVQLGIGRVFDLTGDGDLTAKDYQAISKDAYQPELLRTGPASDYFYLPLPAGDTGYQRMTWDQVKNTGSGTLTLEFLGVEQGTVEGEYVSNLHGPFDTKTQIDEESGEEVRVPVALKDQDTGEDNSIFWMGVKLVGSPLDGQYIENFSLSLTYDSRYVEPAQLYTAQDKSDYVNVAGSASFDGWSYTLRKYNLRPDTSDEQVIWHNGAESSYDETGSTKGRPYQTHYSKVVGELEQDRGTSSLQELRVTLRYQSSGMSTQAIVRDGYLLVIPFKLKMHPPKSLTTNARLIELSAGMRDLTLVTSPPRVSSFMATLFGLERATGEETTAAFSAQEEIYGGTTQNLRDGLRYDTASGTVPIGKDNTERFNLDNPTPWTYGVERYATQIGSGSAEGIIDNFPPGLEFIAGQHRITGIPLWPREEPYQFRINDLPFELTVVPKDIRYRPVDAVSYYGEPEYRGTVDEREKATGLRNFEFQYNAKDLCDGDRDYAKECGIDLDDSIEDEYEWRDGAELERILNRTVRNPYNDRQEYTYEYTAPGFTAYLNAEHDPVRTDTVVSQYIIDTTRAPTSTCYTFTQVNTAKLYVQPRPVLVDYIYATAEDSGLSIYSDEAVGFTKYVLYDKGDTTRIYLTLPELESDGLYSFLPLTGKAKLDGDTVAVTYSGRFLHDPEKDTNTSFQLTQRQEKRWVEPQEVSLLNSVTVANQPVALRTSNYVLVEKDVHSKDRCRIEGMVTVRGVAKMEITALPQNWTKQRTYGDKIQNPAELLIRAELGEGVSNTLLGAYAYNSPDLFPLVIHYNWVSPEEYAEGTKPENMTSLVGSGVGDDGLDTRPYGFSREEDPTNRVNGGWRDNYLYPDMDGWRVCACVTRYVGDELAGQGVQYIKCYTPPIKVSKKTLTIIAKSAQRFYGEDLKEEQRDFTFRSSDLATKDQKYATRGTSAELRTVFNRLSVELGYAENMEDADDNGYTWPTLEMRDDEDRPVTPTTPVVSGKTYKVVISGAEHPCYDIRYTVEKGDTTTYSNKEGSAPLVIQRRPIIVKTIRGNQTASDGTNYFTKIYADTKTLVVSQDPEFKTDLVAAGDKVKFVLPVSDQTKGTTSYYSADGGGNLFADTCTFSPDTDPDEDAIVSKNGVPDDVKVKYQVRFLADERCYAWGGFTQGFFINDDITAGGKGYLDKDVQVEWMELTGKDSGNYVMVFADDVSYQSRVPSDAVKLENIKDAPANNNRAEEKPYYVSGVGRVYLRPIRDIVITSLGQMTYTYGDQFAPAQAGGADNLPMTVRVEYDTTYDNDPKNNFNVEYVEYRDLRRDETGKWISSYADRGFKIYYIKPGQTREDAERLDQTITSGDTMVPGTHNGATLFVTGRRSARDDIVYSQYASTLKEEEKFFRVGKAFLTLIASNAHKFYGEANPEEDYTFTFDTRQLVLVDQNALRATGRYGTEADLRNLDQGADFSKLRYSTTAKDDSPVGINGKWGEYDLLLTAPREGVLTNYTVGTENAHLYVYPRPVRVTQINSAPDDPVYTVFNDTSDVRYSTEFSTASRNPLQPRAVVGCGVNTSTATVSATNSADGQSHSLPINNTRGLVGNDVLLLKGWVEFLRSDLQKALTGANLALGVQVSGLELSKNAASNRNYTLQTPRSFGEIGKTTGVDPVVWGSAKLRTIKEITIVDRPFKLEYTYGETLDLTGLRVMIEYAQLDQETQPPEPEVVSYVGPEQFQSMGLYVNYWTPGEVLPTNNDGRRALPGANFRAATGDHLTIAPVHDPKLYLMDPNSTPKEKSFVTNGKYLVVSGFQKAIKDNPSSQVAAEPKILGEQTASGLYNGNPTPIKVNPLKLHFTLHAEDKTYDGNVQAAGSITLTNLYDPGEQDADAVYIPVGAAYEKSSMNHADLSALKGMVRNGRVTFTTGAYTPNGEAPLMANGRTDWASGYTWGKGLTFTFPNANVHYVDDSGVSGVGSQAQADYWRTSQTYENVTRGWDSYNAVTAMPVEVTNMVLAGPDAANYTWEWNNGHQVAETSVLMTTRSGLVDGQAATPFATIHKANRASIQDLTGYSGKPAQLMLDRATNVVRLLLEQDLSRLVNNNNAAATTDEFREELHFEYALLYAQTDEDGKPTSLLAQWAGRNGQKAYQDTPFFGGESVIPAPTDEGYQPTLDRLPKIESKNESTIYKGQVYPWADLDKGVVEVAGRTFREDSGFALNPAAYPGGANLVDREGNPVKAEDAYWYYTLYSTDRTNLPRDTVFYPLVRLAETHNYNASGNLSGHRDVTAALLDAAQKTLAAWHADGSAENLAAAQAACQAVLNAAKPMEADAKARAQAQIDFDNELGETGKWPEKQPTPQIGPASAIKTHTQRVDLISVSKERSQDTTDNTEYLVELLEAVWFTDTLLYEEEKFLSAALYNHPTRYYGYFWDSDMSAKVEFNETALNFTQELIVPMRIKQPDGSTIETNMVVNAFDPTLGGRVAKLYVQITKDDGRRVRQIQILPTALYARLGDAAYQLSLATNPEKPTNRRYRWTTSDPAVATVDENGLVTFRGVGTCTITVTTDNEKSSTITVTVSPVLPFVDMAKSIFNFQRGDAWMKLDEDGNFYPHLPMTRAQVVELLDLFLDPNSRWAATTELAYLDVTGQEKYADALKRMTGVGVVTGLPGSAFGGDRLITRAEFATMLARMLRLDTPDTKGKQHQFLDAGEEETWAYRYIDALGMTGVTRGTGGGNFSPSRLLTREEAAAMIARLLTVKLDMDRPSLNIPADMIPTNWSYQYVLQAVNTIVFPDPEVELPAPEDD